MLKKFKLHTLAFFLLSILIGSSCNNARHLKEDQYLLKKNVVAFESTKYVNNQGELSDRLTGAIVQKPNSSFIIDGFKTKLFLYNLRYDRYQKDSANYQLKTKSVEPPVVYDSTTLEQSKKYMEAYLFHQGYFYASIDDTTRIDSSRKKATVEYKVNTGINYLIRRVFFRDIPDSTVKSFVREAFASTFLRAGKEYSADLVDQERGRIASVLRDKGYFYFTKENISIVLDTNSQETMKLDENILKNASDIITNKEEHRPTLDVYISIANNEERTSFIRYGINNIFVYPDFRNKDDITDPSMKTERIDNSTFRYHKYYIRHRVIHNHIFITSNGYYAQSDYDKTLTELNQLGSFESVRVIYFEDTVRNDGGAWLNCVVTMSPADKYDFNTAWEASNGTTYTLGSGVTFTLRNNNVARGANLSTTVLSGGIESQYDSTNNNFFILTRTAGLNTSLEFPKFLFPISKERYSIRNTPRTEVALGANLLDRVNYFMLVNLTTRFTYKWKETKTKSWEVSPFFINDISRPRTDSIFQVRLNESAFLRNAYRETFIEGENITWTYSDAALAKFYDDYSYAKVSIEEAGAIVNGLNRISTNLTTSYSQYVRLDYDIRHYIKQKHALTAIRLYGGVGLPYGESKGSTLPYLKQYFVGGPFSMRGWRTRTLGPGGFADTAFKTEADIATAFIDRTGDIKIELNGEYRFDIFKVFGGLFQFNGALFADAGNIWLTNYSPSFPDGNFQFDRLYTHMALNVGTGIRLDIAGLFVFRVDAAVPLKRPGDFVDETLGIKQGWVIEDIDFLYNKWRKNNLIFNFAIGYPF